jgi:hypothetical protein
MYSMPYAALSPKQQAQAARIFGDALFGTDPHGYDYAVETTSGELTGQRCQNGEMKAKRQLGKCVPQYVTTSGRLQLTDQAVHALAQLLLPGFVSAPAESAPLVRSELPVATPSLSLPGWEMAGSDVCI